MHNSSDASKRLLIIVKDLSSALMHAELSRRGYAEKKNGWMGGETRFFLIRNALRNLDQDVKAWAFRRKIFDDCGGFREQTLFYVSALGGVARNTCVSLDDSWIHQWSDQIMPQLDLDDDPFRDPSEVALWQAGVRCKWVKMDEYVENPIPRMPQPCEGPGIPNLDTPLDKQIEFLFGHQLRHKIYCQNNTIFDHPGESNHIDRVISILGKRARIEAQRLHLDHQTQTAWGSTSAPRL